MKKNNVTIKDVAKEAGVSAATVSYVINDNKEQSISEETKQKIWQVINMLNYKPNTFAKSLRMATTKKLIAVCTEASSSLHKANYMLILENLFKVFSNEYSLIFQQKPYSEISNVDAIISYNLSKEDFFAIGNKNFVPLIALDSNINDPLFFQITTDYEKLKINAFNHFNSAFTFVSLEPSNINIKNEILDTFNDVIFVNDIIDLEKISSSNILTTCSIIYSYFKSKSYNVYMNEELITQKAQAIFHCVKKAVSHEKFDIHNYKI